MKNNESSSCKRRRTTKHRSSSFYYLNAIIGCTSFAVYSILILLFFFSNNTIIDVSAVSSSIDDDSSNNTSKQQQLQRELFFLRRKLQEEVTVTVEATAIPEETTTTIPEETTTTIPEETTTTIPEETTIIIPEERTKLEILTEMMLQKKATTATSDSTTAPDSTAASDSTTVSDSTPAETDESMLKNIELNDRLAALNHPRIVSFGSSRTWGAAILDREHNSFTALLNGTNLGIRGSGPEYPAMCFYSMIGDDAVYDLFIIEFTTDWVNEALSELGQRIRLRFPEATIIFLNFWAPRQYSYKGQPLADYHRSNSAFGKWDVFQPELLDATRAVDWKFEPWDPSITKRAAEACGGHILDLPRYANDPIKSLQTYGDLYGIDMIHFSEKGHRYIADKIVKLLDIVDFDKDKTVVRGWDSTDFCTLWYETGKLPPKLKTNMLLDEFKPTKFALIASLYNNKITLNNPWGKEANLYLSYMATGPDEMYPKAVCRVVQEGKELSGFVLNPHVPGVPNKLHIVMHWKIGVIPPGTSDLLIHVTDEGTPKPWPYFRVVGIILSPKGFDNQRLAANF